MSTERVFTPREIVSELDRYIVGQAAAKRAVAVALRNRWRRRQVTGALKDEITPKNILLMGPTGCGKTEIARRLAKLANAPFVKVEATKFTEVGYVGRDVDSMVRDLVEIAIQMVREEHTAAVKERARAAAEERLLDLLLPGGDARSRDKMRELYAAGALDEREVEIEAPASSSGPMLQMFGSQGMELGVSDMAGSLQEALSSAFGGGKKKRKKVSVKEARGALEADEAAKLVDHERIKSEALSRAAEQGIVFIDEIDKIASAGRAQGPDVSREGVQRDILPIIEGSTVQTKHGPIKTDHVLFICAGAFHMSKPSDLIPELQGRLPIRVELSPLSREDFVRILKETESSLVRQQTALLATEKVELRFTDDGLEAIAGVAVEVNRAQENIGARRLATVLERLLEDESFEAPDRGGTTVLVDARFVQDRLAPLLQKQDLTRYVL
ncbi:MAG: HslU--HslV peptidase ATPase subunit [Deltaproteobacteria bacterium RBG_16_71_12]|nr:MAG: HslU--HslV peptidase ATPase subunit [Deltaproteobacteria bacterium RBG_16_71_12]